MILDVLHKMGVLATTGLGTVLIMDLIRKFVKITTPIGQLIVGVLLISLGLYMSKNFNDN